MKSKLARAVAYLKSHAKAYAALVVSLATFLIANNAISMSADRAGTISAVLTWLTVHLVPNTPTEKGSAWNLTSKPEGN